MLLCLQIVLVCSRLLGNLRQRTLIMVTYCILNVVLLNCPHQLNLSPSF